MRNEKSLLIPLSEPIGYLKQSILEFALMKTHADSNSAARLNRCFNYDVLPFMNQLLLDLFDDYTVSHDGVKYGTTVIPPSTKILINDGIDYEYAVNLSLAVFKVLLDTITTFVPDVNFNGDGYRFNICDSGSGLDLHVSPAYLDNVE